MPHYVSQSEAKNLLKTANRVLVIGCSGGGKSTLSKNLATRFHFDYVSIDRDVRWLPGWEERDKEIQREIISNLVAQERWIMDGSGASTFDLRLPRADLIFWVRVPRHVALLGLTCRVIRNKGAVRPLMAEGCPERIPDREFLSYIWHFEQRQTPKFIRQIDLHGPNVPVCLLKSHTQCEDLLNMKQ